MHRGDYREKIFLRHLRKEKGQISIMVGIMMMTFLLFFAFVINTGMLVNAKINLQNAADLAAYAGASVQGRQLNHISYLNYEMRRQWKKFLFRIYVLGNMAQDKFPRGGPVDAPMEYVPNIAGSENYGVPATCTIFNAADNFCHLTELASITIPPQTFLDAVTDTLRNQLQAIEKIRQDSCLITGQRNLMLNALWLYNTDPTLTQLLGNNQLRTDQKQMIQLIQGMASGLGIVPRELILKFRINTLKSYVNAPVQTSLSKSTVDGFLSSPDPALYERSIQAFYSAYYTLGNHTFPMDGITLDELLPGSSSAASVLNLKEIKTKFDTYAIDLRPGGGDNQTSSTTSSPCEAALVPIPMAQELTLGVYKDPTVLTYYAIRLRGKARILFSPFGDLDLKAYSAAQPFGSRIGPNADGVSFASQKKPSTSRAVTGYVGLIPNLAVREGDSSAVAAGQGWDNQEMTGTLYQFLAGSGAGAVTITSSMMESAYIPAMAPNPWEGARYNIINDVGYSNSFSFERHFDPNQIAGIWAPLFPFDQKSQLSQQLQDEVATLFGTAGNAAPQGLQQVVLDGLKQYIGVMASGGGENGEGTNVVKLQNPFAASHQTNNPTVFMTDPVNFKTSWNEVNSQDLRDLGRVGYSVKFISFDSLKKNKSPTDGQSTWTNEIPGDSEGDLDLPFIKH